MNNKVLTLLGFASKSGNLRFGFDSVKNSLKENKAKLIVIASDISPKSEKEITFFAQKSAVEVIRLSASIETLSHATGRKGGILAVTDQGLGTAIKGGIANGKVENQ